MAGEGRRSKVAWNESLGSAHVHASAGTGAGTRSSSSVAPPPAPSEPALQVIVLVCRYSLHSSPSTLQLSIYPFRPQPFPSWDFFRVPLTHERTPNPAQSSLFSLQLPWDAKSGAPALFSQARHCASSQPSRSFPGPTMTIFPPAFCHIMSRSNWACSSRPLGIESFQKLVSNPSMPSTSAGG